MKPNLWSRFLSFSFVIKLSLAKLHVPLSVLSALDPVEVERGDRSSESSFFPWLASRDNPIVLTNTFATRWPALSLSPNELASKARNGSMRDIYYREIDNMFSYWHTRAFSSLPEMRSGKAQLEQAINVWPRMNSTEFFQRSWGTGVCPAENLDSSFEFYYSNKLDLDFESLQPDLPGLDQLSPSGLLNRSRVMTWIGGKDLITPIHNDAFHNVYVQMLGTKRFILFPPSFHKYLHLFPALHPKHQQSQVILENISSSDGLSIPSYFPNFLSWKDLDVRPMITTLQPGEILFIPEMWFHHVTSMTASLSLNVWTEVDKSKVFEARFQTIDPVLSGCLLQADSKQGRATNARKYLTHLLMGLFPDVHDGAVARNFVRDIVLVPRYFPILEQQSMPSFSDPTNYMFCSSQEVKPRFSAKFHQCVAAQVDAFKSLNSPLDQFCTSKLELRLADVIEFAALWAVGPELVSAFLLDFVRC